MLKLAYWYKKAEESGFKNFNILLNIIILNYQSILNYFDNRSTNASAESFNAKVKVSRSQFRGVRKIDFFYLDYLSFLVNPQLFYLSLFLTTF